MKTAVIILSAGLIIISVVGATVFVGSHRSNRALREANRKLEAELEVAQKLADALRSEKQDTTVQLTGAQDSLQTLQAQIAEYEDAKAKEAAAAAVPPTANPYQVPAYLGQTYLGQAWVVPRNVRMDTNTQRYVCEPVIVLNESFRNSFTTFYTNIVEREIPTTYVENNNIARPAYYYLAPIHHGGPKPPMPPPQSPAIPQPAPTFNPGSGVVTPQVLGTSGGSIKTRPQVLGTPNKPAQ